MQSKVLTESQIESFTFVETSNVELKLNNLEAPHLHSPW